MTAPAADPAPELPPAPAGVHQWLSAEQLDGLTAFGRLLASAGVLRGLIGPREVERLWDRHLLNCAALGEALPDRARVADIGTGAGLPGLVLALVRPDLELILVETLQRRCDFLAEAVAALRLQARVKVVRGRAEQLAPLGADVVTSRAVAALDKLAVWCLPHVKLGGQLLAMKGERAAIELEDARPVLRRWGADVGAEVVTLGVGRIDPPVRAVRALRRK